MGRYQNVLRENRTCRVCGLNVVETEYHFLFDCAPLQWIRSRYYVDHVTYLASFMLSSDPDMVKIMSHEDNIKNASVYICDLFRKRIGIFHIEPTDAPAVPQ